MQKLDDMSLNMAIELYYKKHHALREGDLEKLIELKNKYPEMFEKKKDDELRSMIEYAKEFQQSPRYKELRRLELKGKLTVIYNDAKDIFSE